MAASPEKRTQRVFSMPFGTTLIPGRGALFRLWAPAARQVDLCLCIDGQQIPPLPMSQEPNGWFSLRHPSVTAGDLYQFRIDRDLLVPDPVSRCQADDLHGPSVVYDPTAYCWKDSEWHGRPWEEAVIYELHVGAFTPTGSFSAASEKLDYLAELGVTAIELMPVAQFPGRRNWGYDGALLFAPCRCYGRPDELKELVEAAHHRDLMVFLDVVYNHFGPEGNYLYVYAKEAFFTEEFHTPWGAAINFFDQQSATVRDFYKANALYWLEEFHFDGLRFDAVHAVFDRSFPDILEEIARAVKMGPGRNRHIHLVLENDNNSARYLSRDPDQRARLYEAQWNDDIHHACHTLLTGETEGYYRDYSDHPVRHLTRCLTEGFAYQGEPSPYRNGKYRGERSRHLPPLAFVSFLQNHDQIGNRAFGERLITLCPQQDYQICAALLLLAPSPPLLFMGEEFGAHTPFYFFCNFGPELAVSVTRGRREEFTGFRQFNSPASRETIPDPNDEETFLLSKLDWDTASQNDPKGMLHLYRKLLQLRQQEITPRLAGIKGGGATCRILSEKALTASWILGDKSKLTVCFNLHEHTISAADNSNQGALLFQLASDDLTGASSGLPPKSIYWFLQEKGD